MNRLSNRLLNQKTKLASLGLCLAASVNAFGGVSADEAARLGKDLTPMGAEMAGNADGSIPAWNPEGTPVPAGFQPQSGPDGTVTYIDPYAGEKPLYTVDASNWQQYADNLTEGTKALFEKYGADGFKMNVYPTKREFVAPDWYYKNSAKNAVDAKLEADGQKISNNYPGVPFPLPQSGLEAIWNHMIRLIVDTSFEYDVYYVDSSGKPILATTGYITNKSPMFEKPEEPVGDNSWLKLRINYLAPARRAGEILLVHEPGADYTEGKGRQAWQYLTGQRRVRLAPAVSFDTPNPGVAGTATYDDSFIYNGSPERYTWKLVGKKEIIVPYSNYDFNFKYDTKDVLGEKFIKPDLVRWEKHRVWIVEADLKEGVRHLYKKRRFYLDEDTWMALASDQYDARDNLWRVGFAYINNLYDIDNVYNWSYGFYDVLQGIYSIINKPMPGKYKNGVTEPDDYFTSKGMARGGVR
jgi:Protein of unknown function (DUF1329)